MIMRPRRSVLLMVLAMSVALGVTFIVPLATSVPASTAEAAVRKTVTSDYTLLRRGPRSYVIGTAYRGWTVDAQGPADAGYRWGRVFGDLNGCLWIYEGVLTGSAAATQSCSQPGEIWPVTLFTNGQIGGSETDGASVATVPGAGCPTYDGVHILGWGNVRPWQDVTRATADVATNVTAGAVVRWRYVSRDRRYVMVHNPAGGSTDGVSWQSWFFLPRACLPAILR